MIENAYGEGVFFEDAINHIIDDTYSDAIKESGLDIVSKANFDLADFGKLKDFVYTAEVATRPEVELGQYKGLEIEKTDDTVYMQRKTILRLLVKKEKQHGILQVYGNYYR